MAIEPITAPPARSCDWQIGLTCFLLGLVFSALAPSSIPAAEVEFDRPSGFFSTVFNLTLSPPDTNSTIYYTTNGNSPSPATAIRYYGSIPIITTTVVRAAAFVQNVPATEPTTRTYLFADDILKQTGAPFPKTWGTNEGWPVPAHYLMAISGTNERQLLIEGLHSIPSLSIVTDVQNLFGDKIGIYAHPLERGGDWERPISAELIVSPELLAVSNELKAPAAAGTLPLPLGGGEGRGEGDTFASALATGNAPSLPLTLTLSPSEWGRESIPGAFDFSANSKESLHGRTGFRLNCGLRMHGGTSRQPKESPKHSFRLVFKPRYGPATLRFPLFGSDGAQEFDSLVLRAGNNNSWLDSNGEGRRRTDYLRDEWMRRSMLAMGHPSPRGRFVHLYLNGVYWGVYNLCERPAAAWLAAQEQQTPSAYDFRKANEIESGDSVTWNKMLALVNSRISDARDYQALGQQLDLPEFVDFLILNLYAGNSDWDRSANWCAARARIPSGKFRFFVWDAERTLEELDANTLDFDDDESPPRIFQKLSENAEFRALFAARARTLMFDGGPLSPESAARRYQALVTVLEPAMVAEAARWGTYRRDVHRSKTGPFVSYTVKDCWQPEIDRMLTRYFPQRRDIVLNQFRERGLYPSDKASH